MTPLEAARKHREVMKNRSPKERLSFFWEYYGIQTVSIAIAAVLLISLLVTVITKKDMGYQGVFFGSVAQPGADEYLLEFAGVAGIDTDEYELNIHTSYDIRMDDTMTEDSFQAMQSFAAMVAAGMVDNIAADEDLFLYYSYLGYTVDLRTVLTTQELETLAPHLIYIDGELLEQQENAESGLTFEYGQCPDPRQPEAMTDPIPVAVDIQATTRDFQDCYRFRSKNVCMGICVSVEDTSAALAFMRYAFGLPAAGK